MRCCQESMAWRKMKRKSQGQQENRKTKLEEENKKQNWENWQEVDRKSSMKWYHDLYMHAVSNLFLNTLFPPGNHTSAACSRPDLATSSHINQPHSAFSSPSTLAIHSTLPAHSSACSTIFSSCTFPSSSGQTIHPGICRTLLPPSLHHQFSTSHYCSLSLPPSLLLFLALSLNFHILHIFLPYPASFATPHAPDSAISTMSSAYSNAPHHTPGTFTPKFSLSTIPIT